MAGPKTQRTGASVRDFLDGIEDDAKRRDAKTVARMMKRVTGARPEMWGPSIVGYGKYHYVYDSGREGDWMLAGFSPRKQALTLYIMSGFKGHASLMKKLGKHSTGKSCLYIKKLEDVDLEVLEELIASSVEAVRKRYA
jgi:hypothetical protein